MRIKKLFFFCITLFLLLLTSCQEDRTGEYLARTEEDRWIVEKMQEVYLWYKDIPESGLNYFAVPKDFFPTILSKTAQNNKGDKYSFIEINENADTRYIDQESSYGFDFILYSDFIGKTQNNYARVIFVLPNSPASEAGLKRGDWISGVNNEILTGNNYGYLYRGEARRFATARIEKKENKLQWVNTDTLSLTASRPVEDNPFYVDTIYQTGGKRIAYLMYNRFTPGPTGSEEETTYNNRMIQTFSKFKASGFDDLILDFRYNAGGSLSCSQLMASILAPAASIGKTYCSAVFNDKNSAGNFELPLSGQMNKGLNLDLKKVYIIVSNLTQFAPEILINGLIPYMGEENIILTGTTTNGQNVALQAISTPYNFTLYPVVATLYNGADKSDFYKGFSPTIEHTLSETTSYDSLYALGNLKELLLRNTIDLILTGSMPDVPTEASTTRATPTIGFKNYQKMPAGILSTQNHQK